MNISHLVNYLKLALSQSDRRDFLAQGYLLYKRAKALRRYWHSHLKLCKNFQKTIFENHTANCQSLSVLGAGHLNDIDLLSATNFFSKINLYDADPACGKTWNNITSKLKNIEFSSNHAELTGLIDPWTKQLSLIAKNTSLNSSEIADSFDRLAINDSTAPEVIADCVISLNLLSQIPLFWRDRVYRILGQRPTIYSKENEIFHEPLLTALNNSMAKLQQLHLAQLIVAKPKLVMIISEEYFHYYKQDIVHWQTERARLFDGPVNLPGYKQIACDRWFWHISPQGIEHKTYGAIHEIEATAYSISP